MTTRPCWEYYKKFDWDEINSLNQSILKPKYSVDRDVWTQVAEMLQEQYTYSYDAATGNRAAVGVVLKVLSGPAANNAASTEDRLSKLLSFKLPEFRDPGTELRAEHSKSLTRIIARVPGYDADVGWPKSVHDGPRMSTFGEYVAAKEDKSLNNIKPCSLVWVSFSNTEVPGINLSARQAGTIIGVYEPADFIPIIKEINTRKFFQPDCRSPRNMQGPAGGLYVGQTVSDYGFGPPIRKIKGKIKTGMFGNGTAQTKAHFDAALKASKISIKHRLPGPAPTSKNAFVWIGHLKNNGYLDLVDRPITPGRETIIYASKMLDTSSPIEIKYYFHDAGGFGSAWIRGPATGIGHSRHIGNGNDFAEKVAPGIKDLIKDKRNFILVIPEMLYSKGYGTGTSDADRTRAILFGGRDVSGAPRSITSGRWQGQTARTRMSSEVKNRVRRFLSTLPTKLSENLGSVTRLDDREYSTFDGSITCGDLSALHTEVLGVLKQHLGVTLENIGFTSILADGLGAINLAAIAERTAAGRQTGTGLEDININRIDFVDTGLDNDSYYIFPYVPSHSLYKHYLLPKTAFITKYLEFNYITDYPNGHSTAGRLFNKIGLTKEFLENFKATTGPGERKFSVFTSGDNMSKGTMSMYISGKNKAAYAFSLINDFATQIQPQLVKSNSDDSQRAITDSIPDHAAALATKKGTSALVKYARELEKLKSRIENFEEVLEIIKTGSNNLCIDNKYKFYCKNGIIYPASDGVLYKQYLKYLENKKKYMKLNSLVKSENILKGLLRIDTVQDSINQVEKDIPDAQDAAITARPAWDFFAKSFNISNFVEGDEYYSFGNPESGTIADYAEQIIIPEALKIHLQKLKDKKKSFENNEIPQVPIDCGDSPKPLSDIYSRTKTEVVPTPIPPPEASKPTVECNGQKIQTPKNELELTKMIPYYPTWIEIKPTLLTDLPNLGGFKIKKFKYRSRNRGLIKSAGSGMWECIVPLIEKAWDEACSTSGYVPFEVINSIRGFGRKSDALVAKKSWMSSHAWGLAFDLDPFIAGFSRVRMMHSVWTGAWTRDIGDRQELIDLGVFSTTLEENKKNIYNDDETNPRSLIIVDDTYDYNNWKSAPSAYKIETGLYWGNKLAHKESTENPIVPPGSNPTLWLVTFCEKSGMIWGNSWFLKKRWSKTSRSWKKQDWTPKERKAISRIYGFEEDLIKKIENISWNQKDIDDHMHFQFFKPTSLISFKALASAKKQNKKKKPPTGDL